MLIIFEKKIKLKSWNHDTYYVLYNLIDKVEIAFIIKCK